MLWNIESRKEFYHFWSRQSWFIQYFQVLPRTDVSVQMEGPAVDLNVIDLFELIFENEKLMHLVIKGFKYGTICFLFIGTF